MTRNVLAQRLGTNEAVNSFSSPLVSPPSFREYARGDHASTRDECATLVASDCADRMTAESARLLRHEQGHFDLTCAMASKANAMLPTTPHFADWLRAACTELSRQQRRYDSQTNHGCHSAVQTRWEADIAAGLPAVGITIRSRRGRRR